MRPFVYQKHETVIGCAGLALRRSHCQCTHRLPNRRSEAQDSECTHCNTRFYHLQNLFYYDPRGLRSGFYSLKSIPSQP